MHIYIYNVFFSDKATIKSSLITRTIILTTTTITASRPMGENRVANRIRFQVTTVNIYYMYNNQNITITINLYNNYYYNNNKSEDDFVSANDKMRVASTKYGCCYCCCFCLFIVFGDFVVFVDFFPICFLIDVFAFANFFNCYCFCAYYLLNGRYLQQ